MELYELNDKLKKIDPNFKAVKNNNEITIEFCDEEIASITKHNMGASWFFDMEIPYMRFIPQAGLAWFIPTLQVIKKFIKENQD